MRSTSYRLLGKGVVIVDDKDHDKRSDIVHIWMGTEEITYAALVEAVYEVTKAFPSKRIVWIFPKRQIDKLERIVDQDGKTVLKEEK